MAHIGQVSGAINRPIEFDLPTWMACAAFTGVAWYNVIELNVSVYMTFKRKRGLYFWSLVVSSWGVVLHSLGFLLKLYGLCQVFGVTVTIITIGWWAMVTGQALVLYSRLHLVVKEQRILRAVLIMIIWNAITLHIPTTVMTYGSNSPDYPAFANPYNIMERLQMTIFCLQEFIISGIYLWATLRLLKPVYRRRTRSVMMQLLWINMCIMFMDIAMLVVEYMGYYAIETMMKAMIYSIKLKLEFAVLNQLMRLANSSQNAAVISYHDHEHHQAHKDDPEKPRSKPMAFLRRMLPGRNPFHDEAYSIRSPSVPHGAHPHGSVHQRNLAEARAMSSVASPNKEHARHVSDSTAAGGGPPRGISLTTEITQVTTPKDKVWRPSLDRHAALSESHLREAEARERNASVATIYNNPAAFYPSPGGGRHHPPHHRDPHRDPLAVLDSDSDAADDDDDARPAGSDDTSPTAAASEKILFAPSPDDDKAAPPTLRGPADTDSSRPRSRAPRLPKLHVPSSTRAPSNPRASTHSRSGAPPTPPAKDHAGSVGGGRKSARSSTVVPDLPAPAPPSGVLRSTRPSVTEWTAGGSDGGDDSRASSDEVRLDPHERAAHALYDRGSSGTRPRAGPARGGADAKVLDWEERGGKAALQEKGRGGEASGPSLDFMTSAL